MTSRGPQLPEGFKEVDFQFAARHAEDNRECIRLLGLSFLQQGLSISETAALLSVTNDAVHDWLHRLKKGGLSAMKDQGGRGRIVGRDILKMLESDFQKQCDLRTVYKLLHRVQLSWISGRSKHPKQNLDEQEAFKKTSDRK